MTDKEKKVDEIARVLAKCSCHLYDKCPQPIKHNCVSQDPAIMMESSKHYVTTAIWLVNAGYRKERQGEWKYNRNSAPYEKLYYCSLCAHGESDDGMDNYCPHCGARMKGE